MPDVSTQKPDGEAVKYRIKCIYDEIREYRNSRKIKVISENEVKNSSKLPEKNQKIIKIVNHIENNFLKEKMSEQDYIKYKKCISNNDINSLKTLSKKYLIDLGSVNGYKGIMSRTEDPFLKEIMLKLKKLYI